MTRQAVIDVGTNSVKFHVGELRPDGTWTTVVDRADVSRLGEGIDGDRRDRSGGHGANRRGDRRHDGRGRAARRRRRHGRRHDGPAHRDQQPGIHRAGQRSAAASRSRSSRATTNAGSRTWRCGRRRASTTGSLVVFDTGGGSSQFTFGRRQRASIVSSASTWGPSATPSDFTSTRPCRRRSCKKRRAAIAADLPRARRLGAARRSGRHGGCGHEYHRRDARLGKIRSREGPGSGHRPHAKSTGRSSVIEPLLGRCIAGRSWACNPSGPRSSWPVPASCERSWTSWGSRRSRSATVVCGTAC